MRLLVNVDHVATLRNARGEGVPDPVKAAQVSEKAGAAGIVFHLREDRRHIKDDDAYRMKKAVEGILDFEMAATDEMIEICSEIKPHLCTLVPEKRQELTTEGGLDMKKVYDDFEQRVFPKIRKTDVKISLFIDPNKEDIDLAYKLGADAVELHTGTFSNAKSDEDRKIEIERLAKAADYANELGLTVNAGHGLDFGNIEYFLQHVSGLEDVSIGHAMICDAIFNGLSNTVRRMADIIEKYNKEA